MTGYRRAALTLHALTQRDRAWILDALPATDRRTVTQCLGELDALGFMPDQSIVDEALANLVTDDDHNIDDATRLVRQADPRQLFVLLESELVTFVVALLALENWTWAPALIELFPAQLQGRLRNAGGPVNLNGSTPAPARRAAILAQLATRLAAMTPTASVTATNAPHGLLSTAPNWRQRLRSIWNG